MLQELRTTLLGAAADSTTEKKAADAIAAAVKGRSTDPEAHRLFLQARHFIDRNSRADVTRGIGYLQQALALEPDFAFAWAELSRAHASAANWGWASAAEGFARARESATRALELEPDLAEGHAGLGWVQMPHDRDWAGRKRPIAARSNWHRGTRSCSRDSACSPETWGASMKESCFVAVRWSRIR